MPVLVVPQDAADANGPVLVAFDSSEAAAGALAAAGSLLRGRDAVVVHVWRSQIRQTLSGQALRQAPLEEIREIVDELDGVFESWGREGRARHRTRARARPRRPRPRSRVGRPGCGSHPRGSGEEDAAAIVVGRRGSGAVARRFWARCRRRSCTRRIGLSLVA
jgi:nucleotide-binding universal stress UspA family protein